MLKAFKRMFRKICSVVVIAYFVVLFGDKIMEEIIILSKKFGLIYWVMIKGYEGLSILSVIGVIIAGWLVIALVLWITEDDEQETIEELEKEEA